ncbi:MAG TPA: 4-(cytidine 5'-diphospho)-2-C-methyl-D-erythritol kinase [Chloroflexota bacterium]|nr:4-(cytidine 5'-diphospho)-2-C-methyl-D-erythritol kinase [Chloroflexota bacterium]
MSWLRASAYAKVNLMLEVAGRQATGFHELISVMQTVSLADDLVLEPAEQLTLACDVPALGGPDNLVLRAARLVGRGGAFRLLKRIPMAAGLGGGSSDAAAALRLLNAVYQLGLTAAELLAAAATLGSDVPFFLLGGTALAEGRGERLTPLPPLGEQWLVLLNPGVPLSTGHVFGALAPAEQRDGSMTRQYVTSLLEAAASARAPSSAPAQDVPSRPVGLHRPQSDMARRLPLPPLVNSLEAPAERLEPRIGLARQALVAAGAQNVLLSGSGPTLFALTADESSAQALAASVDGTAEHFVSAATSLLLRD